MIFDREIRKIHERVTEISSKLQHLRLRLRLRRDRVEAQRRRASSREISSSKLQGNCRCRFAIIRAIRVKTFSCGSPVLRSGTAEGGCISWFKKWKFLAPHSALRIPHLERSALRTPHFASRPLYFEFRISSFSTGPGVRSRLPHLPPPC